MYIYFHRAISGSEGGMYITGIGNKGVSISINIQIKLEYMQGIQRFSIKL
jgi:hypothetical protein